MYLDRFVDNLLGYSWTWSAPTDSCCLRVYQDRQIPDSSILLEYCVTVNHLLLDRLPRFPPPLQGVSPPII